MTLTLTIFTRLSLIHIYDGRERGGQEVLVPTSQIKAGDKVVVHMGNIIPFDGVIYTDKQ